MSASRKARATGKCRSFGVAMMTKSIPFASADSAAAISAYESYARSRNQSAALSRARCASEDSAPATTRAWPSSSAAMRCTAPMKAPRPPPTMPARRRRSAGAVARLLIAGPCAGRPRASMRAARQPHLAGGVAVDDDVEVLAAEADVLQRQRLPVLRQHRRVHLAQALVVDAQSGEAVDEALHETGRGGEDVTGVVGGGFAAHVV